MIEKKNDIKKRRYFTRRADRRDCPIRTKCIGKSHEKRIDITYYRDEDERAISRLKSNKGKYMKSKRQSTVEPVFGSLINYYGMRKVNTKGASQANKVMMMAATAYNLKKLLKYSNLIPRTAIVNALSLFLYFLIEVSLFLSPYKQLKFVSTNYNFEK